MTATYTENVVDASEYRRPIKGADVFLLNEDGTLAVTTGANPTVTDVFGFFTFTAADGLYLRDVRVAGVSYARDSIIVGSPPQFIGGTGADSNSYASLAALKAAAPSGLTYNLVTTAGLVSYAFVASDFTGRADDNEVIKLNAVSLAVGALIKMPTAANLPTLLDGFASITQLRIKAGTQTADLSTGLRDLIQTGQSFQIPLGIYPTIGGVLEAMHPGQVIQGAGGTFQRLNGTDGTTFEVSADDVELRALRFMGPTSVPNPGPSNDIVRLLGLRAKVDQLVVSGSRGGNLVVVGAGARIRHPILRYAKQNNLQIVCDDVHVEHPICQFTEDQNNIFTTASADSSDNGQTIKGIIINDPYCTDAADTGIELGYGTGDSQVNGGQVHRSVNPELLQRDGLRNKWNGIQVFTKPYAEQVATHDAIALVPAWRPTTWDSQTEFNDIQVHGQVKRTVFYGGQSGVSGHIYARAFPNGTAPAADGSDLHGVGVGYAADTFGIHLTVDFDGYKTPLQTNLGSTNTVRSSSVKGRVTGADTAEQYFGSTLIDCEVALTGATRTRGAALTSSNFTPTPTNPTRSVRHKSHFVPDTRFTGATAAPFDDASLATGMLLSDEEAFFQLGAGNTSKVGILLANLAVGTYVVTVLGTNRTAILEVCGPTSECVRVRGSTDINGTENPSGLGIQLTYESGALVAFQRDPAAPALTLKIRGPGIQ